MATFNPLTPSSSSSSILTFEGSPEYITMRECCVVLVDLLKESINSVGDALFARGLIPPDVKSEIRENSVSSANKVRIVVDCLTNRIKYDPTVYHEFMKTLREQGPWTKLLVEKLTTCYESQTVTPESSIVSLTNNKPQSKLRLEFTVPHDCPIPQEVFRALESVQVSVLHMDQNNSARPIMESQLRVERDKGTAGASRDPQIEWMDNQGRRNYRSAGGNRDILFLVSNTPANNPDIVSRRSNRLTEEEREKLEGQGVHRDCHHDDLSIMEARYGLDKRKAIAGVMSGEMTCEGVKMQITHLMNSTDKAGVVLYYIGHGKMGTGDWCFGDGFITFRELMDLYMSNQHFRGRVLTIISDCSYSGSWVREAMVFMDEHGVGPCGHVAKEKGILVKVYTSCLSNETPAELAFSTHCAKNDKNTGDVSHTTNIRGTEIHNGQHTSGLDFSTVRCKNKIDQPCTMAPGSTWQKWSASMRIYVVRGIGKGQPVWCYVLVVDDDATIQAFLDAVKSDSFDVADYGNVLRSGWGEDPPNHVKEYIDKEYDIDYS